MTLFLILRNLDQKCGESDCLALRNILFLFLMYRLIVEVIHGGTEDTQICMCISKNKTQSIAKMCTIS